MLFGSLMVRGALGVHGLNASLLATGWPVLRPLAAGWPVLPADPRRANGARRAPTGDRVFFRLTLAKFGHP